MALPSLSSLPVYTHPIGEWVEQVSFDDQRRFSISHRREHESLVLLVHMKELEKDRQVMVERIVVLRQDEFPLRQNTFVEYGVYVFDGYFCKRRASRAAINLKAGLEMEYILRAVR